MKSAIQIHDRDNVATAPQRVAATETIEIISPQGKTLMVMTPNEDIPAGHKLALSALAKEEKIVKYGETIGVALCVIQQGEWVHTHNVKSGRMSGSGETGK